MTERPTGYIKWFNLARRYGFIRREGGQPDVFVCWWITAVSQRMARCCSLT